MKPLIRGRTLVKTGTILRKCACPCWKQECSATPSAFPKVLCCSLSPDGFLLSHIGSRATQLDVPFFDKGAHRLSNLLAAREAWIFQVTYDLRIPDSHGSHTCYQGVQIRASSLSQLGDEILCLSLCQTMRVSISNSEPPLDFQIGRRKYHRPRGSTLLIRHRQTMRKVHSLCCLCLFSLAPLVCPSTVPSFESILSSIRFCHLPVTAMLPNPESSSLKSSTGSMKSAEAGSLTCSAKL